MAGRGWGEVAAEVRAIGSKIDQLPRKYNMILRSN